MLLSKLIEESKNLREAIEAMDHLGRRPNTDMIKVRSYIVHAFWRKPARRRRMLKVIQGGRS